MGSNLGFTPIAVEFHRSDPKVAGNYRSIYYARYIDWFITTPLLLLDLLLTAGMPWPTILWVIMVDEIMVITGLIGALIDNRYKWAYFAFGKHFLFSYFVSEYPARSFLTTRRLLCSFLHRLPTCLGVAPSRKEIRPRC